MKYYCLLSILLSSSWGMSAFLPLQRPYDVQHYKVALEIDPSTDPQDFAATVEIKGKSTGSIREVALDLEDIQVTKIEWVVPKQAKAKYEVKGNKQLQVQLPKKLKPTEGFALKVTYKGKIQSAHYGLFKVTDPDAPERGPLLFTQFEALAARRFMPCNDEPYDKASTEIIVKVPARYEVLSNGKLAKDVPYKKGSESWHEVHWLQDKPHSTYLMSLAIAPFAKISEKVDGKEVSIWTSPKKVDRAKYALDVTRQSYLFYERYLGVPYPWEKYATLGIPTFLWGGMENTSSTHMNEERILLNDPNSAYEKKHVLLLAAHELAHQWFGDLVTMKWWDDVWLNESFATLMETLAMKEIQKSDEAEMDIVVDAWDDYFRQEDGPRSHPIVDKGLASADDAFDAINYTKGANVLRMLSFFVGEDKFRAGVKTYLEANALGNATYTDFFSAFENTATEPLKTFRDSWLLQRGYPVITYGGEWNKKDKTYRLKISQRPNHVEDSHVFVFRLPVAFHRSAEPAYSSESVILMEKGNQEITVTLPAEPEWVSLNQRSVVLAKITPSVPNSRVLTLQLQKDTDPFSRLWAAYEFMGPLLEGKEISNTAEAALAKSLAEDPSPYFRNSVLDGFKRMKARWLPQKLGTAVYELSRKALEPDPDTVALYKSDPHGWSQWRSKLIGTLGKVDRKEVLPLLALVLGREGLALDDLGEASTAVAALGDEKSAEVLRTALKIHAKRGYRYQFSVQYAFGAYESPNAANEIRELSKTAGSDLMGRIGRVVRNNQTLRLSPEWSIFLREFALENARFGDEVKTRLLDTIEDVKTPQIKDLLEALSKQSSSERIRESAKKILGKNYSS